MIVFEEENKMLKEKIEMAELESVTGGTFTPNKYSKDEYHAVGICTQYNIITQDRFKIMGVFINYDTANQLVSIAQWLSETFGHRSYSDPDFIDSYNIQVKQLLHIRWDGVPGYDF